MPGSPLVTTESARNGALFVTLANLLVNSPYARCAARSRTRLNAAASQNAVVPPLPSTTSYPSGREKNEVRPSRTRCTRSLTGFCRCDVPSTVVAMDARYSTCSGRTLLGPEPKRPSEGFSSSGIVIAGVWVAVVTTPVSRTRLRGVGTGRMADPQQTAPTSSARGVDPDVEAPGDGAEPGLIAFRT